MPEQVLEAYTAALRTVGNPASTHAHGQSASELLESARERIAEALRCGSAEVTLTSGGTESINLALKGTYWARRNQGAGPVILIPEGEHHATIEAAEWLRDAQGADLRWLPIDHQGVLHPEVLASAIERAGAGNVALVSFLWANNEVGSVQPVRSLARVARSAGIPVHVDAVSALGQVPIDFRASGASSLSVSAHKLGGPVGVGALVLGRDASADPLFHGGAQQRARSGTQNVAGAVAFAAALEFAEVNVADRMTVSAVNRHTQMASLRDRLITGLLERVPDAVLRGAPPGEGRLPGNAHFTFPECQGDSLVFLLDAAGISASVGSACQAGVAEVSHVLLAMGVSEEDAIGSLRFTLGPDSTSAEVDALLAVLPDAVARARVAGLS
ncbi:cysteine desulfurase family protein [Leucobacter sp. W1153]|uniref:cysteine desulfurase family protein n=1 Tax=unclassified Leucobacter TaxID=2621730 RepID=UPI003F2A6227